MGGNLQTKKGRVVSAKDWQNRWTKRFMGSGCGDWEMSQMTQKVYENKS